MVAIERLLDFYYTRVLNKQKWVMYQPPRHKHIVFFPSNILWTSIYGNCYVVKDLVVLAVTDCHTIHIWGKYPPLATHSEGNDTFLLYQASNIKCPQKLTEESWHNVQ